jgi:hypothetical protein
MPRLNVRWVGRINVRPPVLCALLGATAQSIARA